MTAPTPQRRPFPCRIGLHAYSKYVNAYTQAPAPVRCEQCRKVY